MGIQIGIVTLAEMQLIGRFKPAKMLFSFVFLVFYSNKWIMHLCGKRLSGLHVIHAVWPTFGNQESSATDDSL